MMNNIASWILCLAIAASAKDQKSRNSDENKEVSSLNEAYSSELRHSHCGANCITEEEIEHAFSNCHEILAERKNLESRLIKEGRVVKGGNADISLNQPERSGPVVSAKERAQLPFEIVTCDFREKYNLSRDDVANELPQFALNGDVSRAYRNECLTELPQPECDPSSKYRTSNGQCNNLDNPTWGMATACQRRMMPAYYVGRSQYRTSVNGEPLPRPRILSLNLHNHMIRPTLKATHLHMFYGQILDHDLTLTPITTINKRAIQCCPPQNETHEQCDPIILPRNDPFYSRFGITCLNFVRTAICPTCAMGQREQMNLLTSYIDASFVYDNNRNRTDFLRANDGTGRLRITENNFGELLPQSSRPNNDRCSFPQTNEICFEAGDIRANQNNVLTCLQTIFLRQHNRIATILHRINPHWNEETLFQEARRILGAQMQIITYKEYLPMTLGHDAMTSFRLWLSDGERTVYDPQEDASMLTEFTTASFRFGHSMINSVVASRPLNASNGRRLLRNEFFQPFELYNGILGPLVSGAANTPSEGLDRHMVPDVVNFIYRRRGNDTGLDLAAININRGRDNGLPPYVEMVRFCTKNETVVRSFDDLVTLRLMEEENAKALRRNYRFVEDVDLWPGTVMEIPNPGAIVGPTAACVIGLQFHKLKYGDRFFVEHEDQVGSFTDEQLEELKKSSLTMLICLNSDATDLPLNSMQFGTSTNPVIQCRRVRDINLSQWRE